MPVLFAAVADFNDSNSDELVAVAARLNYRDWLELRLADFGGEAVRREVNAMAVRIKDVLSEAKSTMPIAANLSAQEVTTDDGVLDLLAKVDVSLPEWAAAVDEEEMIHVQYRALDSLAHKRQLQAKSHQQKMSILIHFANTALPVSERSLELAKIYYKRTLEMHPLVISLIRLILDHPGQSGLITELRSAINRAIEILETDKATEEPGMIDAHDFWAQQAHLGKKMADLARLSQEADEFRAEANTLVESWHRDLADIDARN